MPELDRQVQATLDLFHSTYSVFATVKPLAVGTREKLLERHPEIEPRLIRAALLKHCKRPKYLKALAAIAERYDLEDHAAGMVSDEERQKAVTDLEVLRELEQAAIKRREEHARLEQEAANRRAEKRKAQELRELRKSRQAANKVKKPARPIRHNTESRSEPMADARPRRPVIIIKKRTRSTDIDGNR